MDATKMSRYTSEHDMSRSVHSFPKTKQHRSIYQHGVDNMLIAKSMLAYSNKMRQISQNRNLIPFLGGRSYKDKENTSKEPQKRLQPKRAKHTVAKQMEVFVNDETDNAGKLEGFNKGRPSSARSHGVFSPTYNIFALPRRPASDPLLVLDKSPHPFNGYHRYGAEASPERGHRRNAETNVLTFQGNSDRRMSVTSISNEYLQGDWIDTSCRTRSILPALGGDSESYLFDESHPKNGETSSARERKAYMSTDHDDSYLIQSDTPEQEIDKETVSNASIEGTTPTRFEALADYFRRSGTPIDDSVLKKPKLVPGASKVNTTERIAVHVKLDGPKLYKEPPLQIKSKSPGKHQSSPSTHESRSFTSQPSSSNHQPSPSKTPPLSDKVRENIHPSSVKLVPLSSNKHKMSLSKAKEASKSFAKTNDESTSNKKPSAIQTKTAEKMSHARHSKAADKIPVSIKSKTSDPKPKLVIDKLVSKNESIKDSKVALEVSSTSHFPSNICETAISKSAVASTFVIEQSSEETAPSSNIAEEDTSPPSSSASSPEILSPSEKEVQQQHLRLFGKTIQESEVKKRMKKPKETIVIDSIPEDTEVVNKHTNTRVGIIGEEQTDTDLPETVVKKKKRVQFGQDMIREVTKIQYPWYFEDSSEEDDDDDEDEDESDEDDKAADA